MAKTAAAKEVRCVLQRKAAQGQRPLAQLTIRTHDGKEHGIVHFASMLKPAWQHTFPHRTRFSRDSQARMIADRDEDFQPIEFGILKCPIG
jgi:hypothetical protein